VHRTPESRHHGTFVLGMGAMRAGTTWIWDYLRASPQFVIGISKECHVLDLDLPSEQWLRARLTAGAREAVEALGAGTAGPAEARLLLRAALAADNRRYIDHFVGVLSRRGPTSVTGDLTPSHALLPSSRLAWVRDSFAERGVDTVPLLVLRDPVERLWSQVKLRRERSGSGAHDDAESQLLAEYDSPTVQLRSRYDLTLAALDEAFPDGRTHVMFYETMFTPEAMAALSDAVGLPPTRPALDTRRNSTDPGATPLDPAVRRTVAEHYADVYTRVAERFPHIDVRAVWPSAAAVL